MHLLHFLHCLSKASSEQRAKGNDSKANAIACIAFGIVLLPVPIFGIPLILIGLVGLRK